MTGAINRRLEALERQAKSKPRESGYDLARLSIEQLRRLGTLVDKHDEGTLDFDEQTELEIILADALPDEKGRATDTQSSGLAAQGTE